MWQFQELNRQKTRGFMVEVYGEQDDFGALCIAGHSQKSVHLLVLKLNSPATNSRRNLGNARPIHRIVIDPREVSSVNFIR